MTAKELSLVREAYQQGLRDGCRFAKGELTLSELEWIYNHGSEVGIERGKSMRVERYKGKATLRAISR